MGCSRFRRPRFRHPNAGALNRSMSPGFSIVSPATSLLGESVPCHTMNKAHPHMSCGSACCQCALTNSTPKEQARNPQNFLCVVFCSKNAARSPTRLSRHVTHMQTRPIWRARPAPGDKTSASGGQLARPTNKRLERDLLLESRPAARVEPSDW